LTADAGEAGIGGSGSGSVSNSDATSDATTASSGSSGSSGSSSGSTGGGDSTVGGPADGGSDVVPGSDALFVYDGPPGTIADAALGCATPNALNIRFNPMYSGYDGTHTYQVPAFAPGADPASLTWGAEDPSLVDIQPYLSGIMITTKKAGDTNIVAKTSKACGVAPIHVAQYTVDQWNLGNARYNNGNPPGNPCPDAGFGDGAPPDGSFDAAGFDANDFDANDICAMFMSMNVSNPFECPPAACTNCHGTMSNGMLFGMTLFSDVQHTPEQTGGFSEDDLTNVFVNGTVPPSGYYDNSITPYCIWHQVHTWTDIDTPDRQMGMRAYLRSLTPQEQTGCFELFASNQCSDGGFGTGTGPE
jgi:hypothetical protein